MTNAQQTSANEAPKTPAPGEVKPNPQQQNQGDGKSDSEKPAQQK